MQAALHGGDGCSHEGQSISDGGSCGSVPPHSIAKGRLEGAETTMRGATAIMDPSCHPDAGEREM